MRRDQRSAEATAYRRWYKTARWLNRRLAQLRAHPLCQMCSTDTRPVAATVADHVTPHRGDPHLFWHGPLQSLCDTCHSSTKQQIETRGYSTDIGPDGLPTDPNHPFNAT